MLKAQCIAEPPTPLSSNDEKINFGGLNAPYHMYVCINASRQILEIFKIHKITKIELNSHKSSLLYDML